MGDDSLIGGAGNDSLQGGTGNDILDGGAGNDSLQDGAGNDIYLFGRGAGQDTIIDYDTTAGNLDKVQIASGVLPADVKVTRDQSHLYLNINNPDGTADKLTLQYWFYSSNYKVEQVVFTDDPTTVWAVAELNALANAATEHADYIEGSAGDDNINGLGGNDTIVGGAGSDTLAGGAGDDLLLPSGEGWSEGIQKGANRGRSQYIYLAACLPTWRLDTAYPRRRKRSKSTGADYDRTGTVLDSSYAAKKIRLPSQNYGY
ncbi:MAG: calcium-binding protein [Methylobacter sp.]|nr:calcium-binding protein [Methylobacter sp.]MDI1278938.1 calcium-binding protein [Methylobacter sp.]MDI1360125.1 calcium-binding protein [Methylobacter sp.]